MFIGRPARFYSWKDEVTAETTPENDTAPPPSSSPPPLPPPKEVMNEDNALGLFGGTFLKSLNGKGGLVPLSSIDQSVAPDVTQPISMGEAVAFALKNNYAVLASHAASSGTFYDKLGAYSEYLPQVQVNVDRGTEYSAPASINDAYGNRVLQSTHPRWDRNIVITQPLIDLNIISDILIAHDHENIAEEDQRDIREGTAYDTANVFLKPILNPTSPCNWPISTRPISTICRGA